MDWTLKLYKLSARPHLTIARTEFVPARQHARPFSEIEVELYGKGVHHGFEAPRAPSAKKKSAGSKSAAAPGGAQSAGDAGADGGADGGGGSGPHDAAHPHFDSDVDQGEEEADANPDEHNAPVLLGGDAEARICSELYSPSRPAALKCILANAPREMRF